MSIVYHGDVGSLIEKLELVRTRLDKRYSEILDKERFSQLIDVAERIFKPISFFSDVDTWNSYLGDRLPQRHPNLLICAATPNMEIGEDGRIKNDRKFTAPVFYFSEVGLEACLPDHKGNIVADYVHNYNRFVLFALQRSPAYLVMLALSKYLRPFQEDLVAKYNSGELTGEEFTREVILASLAHNLQETCEKGNRILDKLVLESIGVRVPMVWRYQEREVRPLYLPNGLMLVQTGGDPFRKFNDLDAVRNFFQWEEHYELPYGLGKQDATYFRNVFTSLRKVEIDKVCIDELKMRLK